MFTVRRSRHLTTVGTCLLISLILATPMDKLLSRPSVGAGVVAAPCTNPAAAGEPQQVVVTPVAMLNMTSMFACEDGNFEVFWYGAVDVPGTIVIGNRTTVTIVGNRTASSIPGDDTTSESGDTTEGVNSSSSSGDRLERLKTSRLSLPSGLSSEIVGAGPLVEPALDDTTALSGPLFYVDGGSLIMSDLVVRDGYAVDANNRYNSKGAGVFAVGAEVNVTRCEFRNNFAVISGGGIYAEESTLVVVDSVFEGCRAGFQSVSGDEDAEGAGGAISAKSSHLLVDGCLFEGNYAGDKGGAIHHEDRHISVVDSVFYDNVAGSEYEYDEDPKGLGGDLSFAIGEGSFEDKAPWYVNDTVFVNGHAGSEGGSVSLSGSPSPWTVEFHRCNVENSSAGFDDEDDPQGYGGAFSVGEGVTLVLSDCLIKGNSCGDGGGALFLSSGDVSNERGGTVIMRNSSFQSNIANSDNGGVARMFEFTTVVVEGDDNVFDGNECSGHGAVFSASANSSITIEGGLFTNNKAEEEGAVIRTKGSLGVVDGRFTNNQTPDFGGVIYASEFSTITLAGGCFEGNNAATGGVMMMQAGSITVIEGGFYSGNFASIGGVFALSGAQIKITGGTFLNNKAEFGGFLYKEFDGEISCKGASIRQNSAVNGGAVYIINDATPIDWACDLRENSATAGGAIYAWNVGTLILREMSLIDNTVAGGSVIVSINSTLETYKVEFRDSSGSGKSAHTVFEGSSYFAEDTSFVGYEGEAVVFNEGELFLDNCDFSGSTSSVLVYSDPNSTFVIRNSILGDNNYLALAAAGSRGGELPNANSFTNANPTCKDVLAESERTGESSTESQRSLCREGSACLDGDLGVYCECYYPQRTINGSKQLRCVGGDVTMLSLTLETGPGINLFPQLVEGDIRLSYNASMIEAQARSSTSDSSNGSGDTTGSGEGFPGDGNGDNGVVWTVHALQTTRIGNVTFFPTSGLLLPGKSNTIRVVIQPRESFDGTTDVTVQVVDGLLHSNLSAAATSGDDEDGYLERASAPAHQAQERNTSLLSEGNLVSGGELATVSFNFTFYHCGPGSLWDYTPTSGNMLDEYGGSCQFCTERVGGTAEGVDCTNTGVTLRSLKIKPGYWRATLNEVFIRECSNEDACKGGTMVEEVDEYCSEGYEGPQCTVCSSGYGRGAANRCRSCSEGFKIGIYFIVVISALVTTVVAVLLAVYLIGGKDAMATTVAVTKETVRTVKRHSARLGPSSSVGGSIDFGPLHARSCSSNVCTGEIIDREKRVEVETSRHSDINQFDKSGGPTGEGGNEIIDSSSNGRTKTRVTSLDGMRGLSSSLDHTLLSKTAPACAGAQACSTSSSGNPHRRPASSADTYVGALGSSTSGRAISQVSFRGARAADQSHLRMPDMVLGGRDKPAASTKIGQTLAALPLSKVKIVIVVWQISSAFAEVTGARFPPIYEKFVAVIGLFSLDLGWIFSMACLATGITFYHRLLIVTIGPLVLLGLLGITFRIGSRPSKPRVAEEPIIETRRWARPTSEGTVPFVTNKASYRDAVSGDVPISRHDNSRAKVSTMPAQGLAQNVTGATDTCVPGNPESDVTDSRQASWIVGVGDENEAEPCGKSSTAGGLTGRPILAGGHSVREMWQAVSESDFQQNPLWEVFSRHATMTLIILYLVYSMVSTVVFQTFACEDYPEINKRYLKADSRIECDTTTHTAYEIYAAIMICIYPLGIPAVFAYLLVRQKSAISPPTGKGLDESRGEQQVVLDKIERRKMNKAVTPTSFLWGAYYPNRYYFEVFECLRRLLLTSVLVFVPDKSGQAAAYGCIFAFLSLCAFELQRPHIDNLETQLYRTGCLVIFFTNFLALIIEVELAQADSSSSAVYSAMLITVHALIVVSIGWNSWATIKATFSRRHIQGIVLGLDIVSEERADNILGPETSKGEEKDSNGTADMNTEGEGIALSNKIEASAKTPSFEPGNMFSNGITSK